MPFKLQPLLLLFLAQGCVGVNIVLSKGLVDHINPFVIMNIRFTLAGVFMLPFLLRSNEIQKWNFHLSSMDWRWTFI
jgi:drug/metabolite transporter (DMT)-like permease